MTTLKELCQLIENAEQYRRIATQAQELATEEMIKRRDSDYENRVLRAELQILRDAFVAEMKKIEAVNERKSEEPGNETWFCCECVGDCSKVGSGVVFDVRIDNSILDVPPFTCPICGKQARIGGQQPANKDGYGSRADEDRLWGIRKAELQREAILAAAADRVRIHLKNDMLRNVIMGHEDK